MSAIATKQKSALIELSEKRDRLRNEIAFELRIFARIQKRHGERVARLESRIQQITDEIDESLDSYPETALTEAAEAAEADALSSDVESQLQDGERWDGLS